MAKTGQMEAVKIMAKGNGEKSSYVILTCVPPCVCRFGEDSIFCQKVYFDESQHSGHFTEDSDLEVSSGHGQCAQR